MNWTEQGAKTASQTIDRYEAAKDDLTQHAVTIKDFYWTIGPYDIVTIVEAADDETASAGLPPPGVPGESADVQHACVRR